MTNVPKVVKFLQRHVFSGEFSPKSNHSFSFSFLWTETDIPLLVSLLSDSSTAIVRIAQYVLVSYEEQSLPHLEQAANRSQSSGIAQETIAMIRNRKTQ
ncbi:MAG: hypothetical protein WEF53_00455 [Bacteroidota bacterium]